MDVANHKYFVIYKFRVFICHLYHISLKVSIVFGKDAVTYTLISIQTLKRIGKEHAKIRVRNVICISSLEQYPAVRLRCLFVSTVKLERASANCFKLSSNKFTDNFAFRYTLLNPSLCFAINVVSRDNVMTFRFPRN